jgi:hypothetical protein
LCLQTISVPIKAFGPEKDVQDEPPETSEAPLAAQASAQEEPPHVRAHAEPSLQFDSFELGGSGLADMLVQTQEVRSLQRGSSDIVYDLLSVLGGT